MWLLILKEWDGHRSAVKVDAVDHTINNTYNIYHGIFHLEKEEKTNSTPSIEHDFLPSNDNFVYVSV